MNRHLKPYRLAQGHVESGRHRDAPRKIACAFDEDTFQQVRVRAERESTSFAEQVRQLVEWGLEAADAD